MSDQEAPKVFVATPTGIIDASLLASIPPRTFRDAWKLDGAVITIDVPTATTIHIGRIRAAREVAFKAIDAQRAIATDAADTAALAVIKTKATQLRDVTKDAALFAATTPDELNAFWPDYLGARGPLKPQRDQ